MKWFNNMKISAKLLAGFILVAFIAGMVGFIGIRNIKQIDENYGKMYEDFGVGLGYAGEAGMAYHRSRVNLRDIITARTPAERDKFIVRMKELDKEVEENLAKYEKSLQTEEGKKVFAKLKADFAKYYPIREQIIGLAVAGKFDEAIAMQAQSYNYVQDINQGIEEMFKGKITNGRLASQQYSEATNNTITLMITIILIAVLVAVALGIYIARVISRPLGELVKGAEKIADGDLNIDIEIRSKDEIGVLAAAFRKMTDNVNDVMRNITLSAQQVAAAARQVSDSSQALSQGSTEQAASVEELSASMEEIAAQTSQNVVNANKVNEMSTTSKEAATRGNNQMKEMLRAMEEINEASSSISKIIKVIDEIAFQTNILALNAAVEAARAGQHGKGFAVVAEEVRNLAARSADAAKETTAMIEGTIKKVEAGTKIANETAGALTQIVEGVTQSAALVAEIASASNEQASGISQVNQGIMQVSQVTQTNSATAEESASASEELSSQADMLRNMVAKFKLRQGGGSESLESLRPDIIKMLESMSGNRSQDSSPSEKASNSKIQIHLDKNDFGKY